MKGIVYVIGCILFIGVIALMIIFAGVPFGAFMQYAALVVLILPVFFLLVPVYSLSGFFRNIAIAFGKQADVNEIRQAIEFIKHVSKMLHITSFIGALVGVIAMLTNLKDPDSVGYGVATLLLVILYNLILQAGFVLPLKAKLKMKLIESE